MFKVALKSTGEVVTVDSIDPTIHNHRSGVPFDAESLETLGVKAKKKAE